MEDNPVIPYLRILLESKNEKHIMAIRKHENDYLEDCHILFVNDNYDGYLKRLLAKNKAAQKLGFEAKIKAKRLEREKEAESKTDQIQKERKDNESKKSGGRF